MLEVDLKQVNRNWT